MESTFMDKIARLYQTIRQLDAKPIYFGLGFIQLKINDNERFHFYHPSLLPIINIEEEVHNHRYDFVSEVLIGELNNKIYHFNPLITGQYMKEYESCNANTILSKEEKNFTIGNLELFSYIKINKGEKYFMDHRTFHTLETSLCMTKLHRSEYFKKYAEVVKPLYGESICPFSLKLSENDCWNIIEQVMLQNNDTNS